MSDNQKSMQPINVQRLHTKSVFKIIFVGVTVFMIPLFSVLGILASVGLLDFYMQGQPVTGIKALFIVPLAGVFLSLFLGALCSVFASLGLIIYGKKRSLTLYYYPPANE
ncbi:hypothetical protein MAH1_07290 [Sessilibacter sp. MAH1]